MKAEKGLLVKEYLKTPLLNASKDSESQPILSNRSKLCNLRINNYFKALCHNSHEFGLKGLKKENLRQKHKASRTRLS